MATHAQLFATAERCLLDSRREAAAFFAEKAFLEASDNKDTQLLYARALFANGDLRRLLNIFRTSEVAEIRDLVGRALLELDEDQLESWLQRGASETLSSTLHYVRGRAAQKRQNTEIARENFRVALQKEELNFEAATALLGTGLLSDKEEAEFPIAFSVFFTPHKTSVQVSPALQQSADFRVTEAKRKFQQRDYRGALRCVKSLFENSDCFLGAVEVYCGCLLALNETSELYFFAHRVMRLFPDDGRSWLAGGLYYLSVNKMEQARKYLSKATSLAPNSLAVCLAYGHAFSRSEEAEQALSVYRTAHRLFPGSWLPLLFLARESLRMNNASLAEKYVMSGLEIAGEEPELLSELGVCLFQMKNYAKAVETFQRALEICGGNSSALWTNLGHAHLKKRELGEAEKAFRKALTIDRKNAEAQLGLAYMLHVTGFYDYAVDAYTAVLRISGGSNHPQTLTAAKMLVTSAMAEKLGHKLDLSQGFNPRTDYSLASRN